MWNLKNKTSEQTKQKRNRLIDIENKLMVARWEWGGWKGKKSGGDVQISSYKINMSWGM